MSLVAPVAGQVIPITDVPDPVFAEKLVGDGVAIDPIEQVLVAPFAGKIVQLTGTSHALTLRSDSGLEVLLHIGIDTVLLKGEGFRALISDGDNVECGQPLIEFDADFIAQKAKSLMTVVVITNADTLNAQFKVTPVESVAAKDPLLSIAFGEPVADIEISLGDWVDSDALVLPNPAGLHARPAAALAKIAKEYASAVELSLGDKRVSAKSLTSILNLGSKFGDTVQVHVNGPDAQAALSDLVAAIRSGLGEEIAEPSGPADVIADEPSLLFPKSNTLNWMKGVSASPGFAVGVVYQIQEEVLELPTDRQETAVEKALLADAIAIADDQLETLKTQLDPEDEDKAKIFSAHIELLSDPELLDYATTLIDSGDNAAQAWQKSVTSQVEQLESLDNTLLAERAVDLRDVGNRVLRALLGVESAERKLPENCVLVADDLTPSDTANLDKRKVVGFVTTGGGATSHSAILARAMNIPAIAGIDDQARDIANGTRVILNADQGEMRVNPEDSEVETIQQQIIQQEKIRTLNRTNVDQPAITQDKVKVEVVANIGSVKDAMKVAENGGEGVGLLRSEFLFLNRTTAPSEEDQFKTYRAAAEALGKDQPLIVRTLDVGGDKPLSYLPLPEEENPFLGERGVRISLDKPAMFRQQLRALLRAAEYGNIHIMFPMIADIRELRLAKQVLAEEQEKLGARKVPVGIMIEVPSAAVMADVFAPEVDFFSVGTNDLTQYALAMDRGHPKLAVLADALHPSVLRLIKMTVDAAERHGKWVGVCGGIAGDLLAVPLLVGLGIKELSTSVPSIPDVKACIRALNSQKCKEQAEQSLQFSTAAEVRDYLETTNQYVV
ncbi:probable phosphoenolpyruvate-protein phosphotransferase [Reinekea sp. MED297]|uniref:phosphoenolpyruvate--protein phosphotransferase n=2 Tax=Reinekea TaxID=230494 RepID=A4B924_9GAMM|nr:probable phosphoenolpyruvate-protein phosphotransferase [Reinekea sp. MED297] [Reinekea blandensis MED297]